MFGLTHPEPGIFLSDSSVVVTNLNSLCQVVTVHPANDADRPAVLARVQDELRQKRDYDPLFNNCQHAASPAAVGQASSEDLQAIFLISVLLLISFVGSKIK